MRVLGVYLDGNYVSAIHLLHVVCAGGQLTSLVDLPGLMERTESAVDCGDARRWWAQGCVHHHVLTQTCSISKVELSTPAVLCALQYQKRIPHRSARHILDVRNSITVFESPPGGIRSLDTEFFIFACSVVYESALKLE